MRIWHEKLIPLLCQKHLCAMWREGLGAYKIIAENRTELTYFKHPAVQEFVNFPEVLHQRLALVREEMLNRGYHPKALPESIANGNCECEIQEWQSLEQQIEILKTKGCKCNV